MFKQGISFGFRKCRHFSTGIKAIPVHVSTQPIDTEKLHLINQSLHQQLGPIFAERLGPDVNVIWISDPSMTETILRNEPKYPMHVVPEAWKIFNQKYEVQRGLFFLDGQDWYQVTYNYVPLVFSIKTFLISDEEKNESDISETIRSGARLGIFQKNHR